MDNKERNWLPWDENWQKDQTVLVLYNPKWNQILVWLRAYDVGGAPILQQVLNVGWEVVGEF